jgi:hypothetical protein
LEFCSSDLTTSGYGSRINPTHTGHTKSPCGSRPETGAPCPIVGLCKDNNVCPCHAITGKGPKLDVWQIAEMYRNGEIRIDRSAYASRVEVPTTPCAFPGCDRYSAKPYCSSCGKTIGHRRRRWIAEYGTEPPEAYLHQPKGRRLAGVKPERKRERRADVYHGSTCRKCGETLRYASNQGCVQCGRDAMIRKAAERRETVTIPAVWMYAE